MKKRKVTVKRTKRKSNRNTRNWVLFGLLIGLIYIAYTYYKRDRRIVRKAKIALNIPKGFEGFGIDISHHHGKIDWGTLFRTERYDTIIDFVYCKATEGATFIDPQWSRNRSHLLEMEIPHGAYHFFRPNTDPEEQAKHFLYHWIKEPSDLPPVLDVETEAESDKELIRSMEIWLNAVEKRCGMRPIIYTSLHFFETKFASHFSDYSFWVAAYSRKPGSIQDKRIVHWQYSEKGQLPGIETPVDFNVTNLVIQPD